MQGDWKEEDRGKYFLSTPNAPSPFSLKCLIDSSNQMENRELYDCTSVVNRADRLFWCGSLLSAQLPFSQSIVNIVLSFFFSQ